jgi:hypothetical protein
VSGELARRFANAAVDRQLSRDLASLHARSTYAQAEVMAIGQVTRGALYEAALTSLECDQAEKLSPGGAETYRFIAWTAAVEMAQTIRTVGRVW